MKKYINLIKNHLLCSYVILNILFLLVTSFLYAYKISTYKINSIAYIPALVINIIVIIICIFNKRKNKEKLNISLYDIFLIIFFIFTLISAILSINTQSAFFGFRGRYEGFFHITYYLSLFFLSSFLNKEEKKAIVYSVLILGVINAIHAHLQKFEIFHVPTIYNDHKPWATGYVTNPNFFGTLMVLCLTSVIGLLIDSNKLNNKKKIIYFILIILFTSGLLISDTLSALVGLIVALGYVLIYAIKKNKKSLLLIIVLLISLITLIESCSNQTTLVKDLIKTKNESIELAKGNAQDNFGTNRIYVWKESIKVIPNNITYGVGVDNFYYAFGDKPLIRKNKYFDKAHNEFLQILVCEGVYALISYMLFIGIIIIRGIKNSFKNNELYLIIPLIAYLIQSLFNISVIEVAPIFYIYLGLNTFRKEKI